MIVRVYMVVLKGRRNLFKTDQNNESYTIAYKILLIGVLFFVCYNIFPIPTKVKKKNHTQKMYFLSYFYFLLNFNTIFDKNIAW